ncbi:hypothetical protein BC831DRAFT_99579 [Entophlyctis helioformis]|nr:hypothetical protein BC831DRAFT_99579 [Entophlyctis helioformis]
MSKVANVLFSKSLADRYGKDGVTAVAIEPGAVATGIAAKANDRSWFGWFIRNLVWVFTVSPDHCANAQIYASVTPDLPNGSSWTYNLRPWAVSGIVAGDRAERLWNLGESILASKGFD